MKWHKLVTENLPLVHFFASKCYGRRPLSDDVISAGNVGLVEAAQRFDPARGVKFSAYAKWWIEARIWEHMREEYGLPRPGQEKHRIVPTGDFDIALAQLADEGPTLSERHYANQVYWKTTRLSRRNRRILWQLIVEEKSCSEVGALHGLTKQRVHQIEAKSLAEMRRICR